jgi:hypothetical protein
VRALEQGLVVDAIEIGQVAAGIEIVRPGIAFVLRNHKAEPLVEIGENDLLLLFRYWQRRFQCVANSFYFVFHCGFPPTKKFNSVHYREKPRKSKWERIQKTSGYKYGHRLLSPESGWLTASPGDDEQWLSHQLLFKTLKPGTFHDLDGATGTGFQLQG